ncbi:MAG: hypothetical protein ACREB9_07490, partial [Thermoplasmata archaeon]
MVQANGWDEGALATGMASGIPQRALSVQQQQALGALLNGGVGVDGGINPGARFVLLDPVRDAAFLSSQSIKNPSAPVNDAGLGVVDNGLFVYTSAYTPGTTTKRPYPIKFFWIGSPAGTTDANDAFSIYMADVLQNAYYAGAPAVVWLVNPRLVLSVGQAKSDIIT